MYHSFFCSRTLLACLSFQLSGSWRKPSRARLKIFAFSRSDSLTHSQAITVTTGPPAYCYFFPYNFPGGSDCPQRDCIYMWHTGDYLCERILKHLQLVRAKPQLTLARREPPRVQERSERFLLCIIERPVMCRHIRVQQSANPNIESCLKKKKKKRNGQVVLVCWDEPGQFLLEIGIAAVALVAIRPVRRRLRQLPHEHRQQTVRAQGAQRLGRCVGRRRGGHHRRMRVWVHNWSRLLVASVYSRTGRRTRSGCDGGYEEVVEEKHDLAPDADVRV